MKGKRQPVRHLHKFGGKGATRAELFFSVVRVAILEKLQLSVCVVSAFGTEMYVRIKRIGIKVSRSMVWWSINS